MSGTDVRYAMASFAAYPRPPPLLSPHMCYAVSGTEAAYAATTSYPYAATNSYPYTATKSYVYAATNSYAYAATRPNRSAAAYYAFAGMLLRRTALCTARV
eukprot:249795-Rhodomonas_salina.2